MLNLRDLASVCEASTETASVCVQTSKPAQFIIMGFSTSEIQNWELPHCWICSKLHAVQTNIWSPNPTFKIE